MTSIGIMQGRLVPPENGRMQAFPRDGWGAEFALAAAAKLNFIEWIYDVWGEDANPLGMADGISRMKDLTLRHDVEIRSICADYFMERLLLRTTDGEKGERFDRLEWLIRRCREAGIQRIVLPFVDSSAILSEAEEREVAGLLQRILPVAELCGVELHLETALEPDAFSRLLAQVPHAFLKVNYDSGNSASLGYLPREEFAAYGGRIGSVHVKDRKRDGGTVPLGTGDVRFAEVFGGLRKLGYQGDFVLQVARDKPGNEVDCARQNRIFVENQWLKAGNNPGYCESRTHKPIGKRQTHGIASSLRSPQ